MTTDGTAATGRRPHLRHRLRHHRLPGPHPGGRRRGTDAGRGVERRRPRLPGHRGARLPQLLPAVRPQHQPRPQLDPVHGGAADEPHPPGHGPPGRSAAGDQPAPLGRRRARGLPAGRSPDPAADGHHRLGGRLHQLVQDGVGPGHQQLADRGRCATGTTPSAYGPPISGSPRRPPPSPTSPPGAAPLRRRRCARRRGRDESRRAHPCRICTSAPEETSNSSTESGLWTTSPPWLASHTWVPSDVSACGLVW